MPTTLADLEARVAALEAEHADYRAVLAAINALAANQREHTLGLREVTADVSSLNTQAGDTNARVRSLEEGQEEIKDLLLRALDQRETDKPEAGQRP